MKAFKTTVNSGNTSTEIEEIDVERFTEKFIVLEDGSRVARISSGWRCYFETREDAEAHIEKMLNRYIGNLKGDIARDKMRLEKYMKALEDFTDA